jgi:hypothetical protein
VKFNIRKDTGWKKKPDDYEAAAGCIRRQPQVSFFFLTV